MLGNIEKRGVGGELENKEYSRLESLLEKHKFYKIKGIIIVEQLIFVISYRPYNYGTMFLFKRTFRDGLYGTSSRRLGSAQP